MNVLLDTCVLIDFLGRKEPFFEDAERVFAAGYFGDAKLWASVQSIKDAYYVLRRFVGSDRVQVALGKMLEVVTLVDTTAEDAIAALRLHWQDYEDCMMAVCASKVHAEYIVTRDVKGFDRSSVPAISPAEWLAKIQQAGVTYGAEAL